MVKKNKIKYLLTFLLLFSFLILIGSGNVISPFYGDLNLIDEGQFLAWINHMHAGDSLYKNTYAAYGPLLIYPFYLISKIFDPSFFLFRITFGVFGMLLSLFIVILILNKLKVSFIFQIFSLFLLVFIPGFGIRQASGLLTIYLTYNAFKKTRLIWSLFAGISLSVSFLVSSDMGIFSFMVIMVLGIIELINTNDFKAYMKKIFTLICGTVGAFLIFYIFSSSEGWFDFYLSSVIDDLVSYSGIGIAIGKKFPNILELFPQSLDVVSLFKFTFSKAILNYWLMFFYILSLIYFFIKFMLKKVKGEDALAFYVTLYGILLSTILIGRIGNFVFVVPIVFILFAYYLNLLFKHFKTTKIKNDKIFSFLIIFVILLFSIRLISIYRPHFNKIPLAIVSANLSKNNPESVGNISITNTQKNDIIYIQRFVNQNTKENEKIFFLSNNPGLYLLVNRNSPSRFDLPEVANYKEKRLEIINDLEKDKTKYIIEYTKAYDVDGISNRRRLPEVMEYIKSNYSKNREGNYIIYLRNNEN